MTVGTGARSRTPRAAGSPRSSAGRRLDIQGLRAIAVGGVLLYHGGIGMVRGGFAGVDIFFVISGFLISSQLLRSLDASGRISLADFYSRRARRILPASFAVLIATAIAGSVLLAPLQRYSVLRDAIATALYVPNYLFAVQGTDYLHETAPPSLFQHYWSLGVEEQFYLIWPLLLIAAFVFGRRPRRTAVVVMSSVVVLSLGLCIWLSYANQPWAFFSLPTRAWEFALGGLLALVIERGWPRIPAIVGTVIAWLGLIGLALVMFRLSDSVVFPGWVALAPVLSTCAVIFGNAAGGRGAPMRILSLGPLTFLGEISYSLYLVHWPILMIPNELAAVHLISYPRWERFALIALCVPVAWLCWRFVETPFRRVPRIVNARRPLTLLTAAACSAVMAVALVSASGVAQRTPLDADRTAVAVAPSVSPEGTGYVPSNLTPGLRAAAQTVLLPTGCELDNGQTGLGGCRFGDNDAAPLVVIFGDSHASEWYPALQPMVESGAIRLQSYTKSGCPSVNVSTTWNGAPYALCDQWRQQVIEKLRSLQPALVLMGAYETDHDPTDVEQWASGVAATARDLSFAETALLVDTPDPLGIDVPTCLSAHLRDTGSCAVTRDTAFERAEIAAAESAGVASIDVDDYLCGPSTCPAVIGDILSYRDGSHITAAMSAALAPVVDREVGALLPD